MRVAREQMQGRGQIVVTAGCYGTWTRKPEVWQLLQKPVASLLMAALLGQSEPLTRSGGVSAVVVQKLPLLAVRMVTLTPLESVTWMVAPATPVVPPTAS